MDQYASREALQKYKKKAVLLLREKNDCSFGKYPVYHSPNSSRRRDPTASFIINSEYRLGRVCKSEARELMRARGVSRGQAENPTTDRYRSYDNFFITPRRLKLRCD